MLVLSGVLSQRLFFLDLALLPLISYLQPQPPATSGY
jgi:hypothetical protein